MRRRFNYTFVSLHAVVLASITANLVNDQVFGTVPQLPVQLQLWLPQLPSADEIFYSLPTRAQTQGHCATIQTLNQVDNKGAVA